jgi:hypothetical protein
MDDHADRQFIARPIISPDELERALRLVHDNYVRMGYMPPHPSGMRITPHHALPQTRTFVGLVDDEVTSTVSLFFDGPLGLPLDEVFPEPLADLRDRGLRLGEVGLLADRRAELKRAIPALLRMMKHVFWTARNAPLDALVIAVRPHHAGFYRKLLCFEQLAGPRPHPDVQDAQALLLELDLKGLTPEDARKPELAEMFFGPIAPAEKVEQPFAMDGRTLQRLFNDATHALAGLTDRQLACIHRMHGLTQGAPPQAPASGLGAESPCPAQQQRDQ